MKFKMKQLDLFFYSGIRLGLYPTRLKGLGPVLPVLPLLVLYSGAGTSDAELL